MYYVQWSRVGSRSKSGDLKGVFSSIPPTTYLLYVCTSVRCSHGTCVANARSLPQKVNIRSGRNRFKGQAWNSPLTSPITGHYWAHCQVTALITRDGTKTRIVSTPIVSYVVLPYIAERSTPGYVLGNKYSTWRHVPTNAIHMSSVDKKSDKLHT